MFEVFTVKVYTNKLIFFKEIFKFVFILIVDFEIRLFICFSVFFG